MATKKKIKMPVWDSRMLDLMDRCIADKIKCTTQEEFCEIIKFNHRGLSQLRAGKASFRHEHIHTACKVFNKSPNYFYGFTDNDVLDEKKASPFTIIDSQLQILKGKR